MRKSTIPTSSNHRYGLQFNITNQNVHLLICILLAGDIATTPGPCSARCLVVNARSLVSIHKTNGKNSCHLTNFQNLVYTEQADLVWVTEAWLRNDILSSEILPWGVYTIFRKDRKSRAGGVLLAVKSTTFSSCREINFDVDLELVTVEIVSKSNMKHLVCCCYKPPQNVNKQWLESSNLFLAKSCATYHNVLLCGDLNFPNIPWYSPELATSADEVQFTEILNDYYLSQLNSGTNTSSQYVSSQYVSS